MKKWLCITLFIWLVALSTGWAQKIIQRDLNPPQDRVRGGGEVTKVEYTRHKMIIHFKSMNNQSSTLYGPGHRNCWRLIDRRTGDEYRLIYIKNIEIDGYREIDYLDEADEASFRDVEKLTCEAHFERPGKGASRVDLIEKDIETFVSPQHSQWPYNVYALRVLPYDERNDPALSRNNLRLPPSTKPKTAPPTASARKPVPRPKTAPPTASAKKPVPKSRTTPPTASARKPTPAPPARPRPLPRDTMTARAPSVKPPVARQAEDFGKTPVEVGKTYRLSNLIFAQSDYRIQSGSYSQLDTLAALMKKNPSMTIELSGHTDNVGNAKLNLELSRQRVQAVKTYLVGKGIEAARIKTQAYGGTRPVADNSKEETRRLNRRVEVTIL